MKWVIVIFMLFAALALIISNSSITGNAVHVPINLSVCNDSDGGKNFEVFGKACLNGTCIQDKCEINRLSERYCFENIIKTTDYNCPIACEYGRCINPSEETTITICNDSDGKDSYEVKGYIELSYDNNTTKKINDLCEWSSIESKYIAKDYFCIEISESSYDYSYSTKACERGCTNCPEEQEELNETINITEEIKEPEQGKILIREKELGEYCRSNYACKSNLCISNECSTNNFFEKIREWIKGLF